MSVYPTKTALRYQRTLDDAVYAYVDWRDECTAVWHAYRRWAKASTADAALAFGAYTAALDREESAAKVYAELMRRVDDLERTCPAPTDSECGIDAEAATGAPLPLPIAPSLEQKSKRRP
jgi:hypothetical protein